MAKITNAGQFNSLYNRNMVSKPNNDSISFGIRPDKPFVYRKPNPHKQWNYNKGNYTVWSKGNIFIDYDRKQPERKSDCVKEQERLYRQLKREYEREQKEFAMRKAEKIAIETRKRNLFIQQTLPNSPRYDRIYG